MNFIMSWCNSSVPEKPTRSELTRWAFKHGSVVWASTRLDAIDKLSQVNTDNFWASEIEQGIWDVQFEKKDEPFVIVLNVNATTGYEAARTARWALHLDHQMKEFI